MTDKVKIKNEYRLNDRETQTFLNDEPDYSFDWRSDCNLSGVLMHFLHYSKQKMGLMEANYYSLWNVPNLKTSSKLISTWLHSLFPSYLHPFSSTLCLSCFLRHNKKWELSMWTALYQQTNEKYEYCTWIILNVRPLSWNESPLFCSLDFLCLFRGWFVSLVPPHSK